MEQPDSRDLIHMTRKVEGHGTFFVTWTIWQNQLLQDRKGLPQDLTSLQQLT